jgi:hypothetical protein
MARRSIGQKKKDEQFCQGCSFLPQNLTSIARDKNKVIATSTSMNKSTKIPDGNGQKGYFEPCIGIAEG